jgi:phage shock protein B
MTWVLAILFLTIVVPLWIVMHFVTKWKMTRELSTSEEDMIEEVWNIAHRMESRINALETILDAEAPEWRGRT